MPEHPILFKGPMMVANMNCQPNVWPAEPIDPSKPFKWQTRRVMGEQPPDGMIQVQWCLFEGDWSYTGRMPSPYGSSARSGPRFVRCPYGVAGDGLWTKEGLQRGTCSLVSWRNAPWAGPRRDGEFVAWDDCGWKRDWLSPIHMPRWAARELPLVKRIRVERVQDISDEDAIAEGIEVGTRSYGTAYRDYRGRTGAWFTEAKISFGTLWDSINANPKPVHRDPRDATTPLECYVSYPWEAICETREKNGKPWFVIGNPWNWVVDYMRTEAQA